MRRDIKCLERLDMALCVLFNESGQQYCMEHVEAMQKLALAYDELRKSLTSSRCQEQIGFKRFDTD